MKGCWNICERKVYLSFFFGWGCAKNLQFFMGFWGHGWDLSLFFLKFRFFQRKLQQQAQLTAKKGWFWDPFFHGKMIWQSSNFATFTKKFRWPAQKLRPESQHRDSMGFLSTPPLTILYSHGNAEDPAAAMGWGGIGWSWGVFHSVGPTSRGPSCSGNWKECWGMVEKLDVHLAVSERKLWCKMKHEVLFNRI